MSDQKTSFRVLTLDGGGMRAVYTASLLQTLAQRFDAKFKKSAPDIGKAFDLICGTSTGSILACGLALGIPLHEIISFYRATGKEIFPSPVPKNGPRLIWWVLSHWTSPAGNADRLRQELEKNFGSITLGEVYERRKIGLCIPTVDASRQKAWVFKTPHIPGKKRDDNYKLSDVCLASCATPILFPVARLTNPDDSNDQLSFVDGGLWANNPVIVGLVEALEKADNKQTIDILSVGTIEIPGGEPQKLSNPIWGLAKWKFGVGALEHTLNAQATGYHFMAQFLAKGLGNINKDKSEDKDKEVPKVRVFRLPELCKSGEQYGVIGLDRADSLAFDTMVRLAHNDADFIHGQALGNRLQDNNLVMNIFESLEPLPSK